jgi:hypothetical protein
LVVGLIDILVNGYLFLCPEGLTLGKIKSVYPAMSLKPVEFLNKGMIKSQSIHLRTWRIYLFCLQAQLGCMTLIIYRHMPAR